MKGIEAKIRYIRNKYDQRVCKIISEIRIVILLVLYVLIETF